MKTLINKNNPQIRIIAPEIVLSVNKEEYWVAGIPQIPRTYLAKEWILVEDEPKHTEVWVEGRTIFEQDAKLTEVNLEEFAEKMDAWKARFNRPDDISIKATMAFTARMFYQYPNVARQWYEQLPKATMD